MAVLRRRGHIVTRLMYLLMWILNRVAAESDGVSCAAPDAGNVTSAEGVVTSPGYPYDYPNLQQCEWLIQGPKEGGRRVILQFESFTLEGNNYDYLAIHDGENTTSKRLAKLSGHLDATKIADIISSGPQLYLLFVSDKATAYSGFKAKYHTINIAPFDDNGLKEDCSRLSLQGTDEAWQHEGLFLQTDMSHNSRPVYKQHGTQADLYLYFHLSDQHRFWLVGAEVGSGEGYLYGDTQDADADSPYEDGIRWHEAQNGAWETGGNIHVTCLTPATRLLRGPKSYFYLSEELRHKTCMGRHVYHQIFPACRKVAAGRFPECPPVDKKKDLYLYYVNTKAFSGWMLGPEQCVADGWIAVHDHAVRPQEVTGQWQKLNSQGIYEDYHGFFVRNFDNWPGKRRSIKNHKAIHPLRPLTPYSQPGVKNTGVLWGIVISLLLLVVVGLVILIILWICGKVSCHQEVAEGLRKRFSYQASDDDAEAQNGAEAPKVLPPRDCCTSNDECTSNEINEDLVRVREQEPSSVEYISPGATAGRNISKPEEMPDFSQDKKSSNGVDTDSPDTETPFSCQETGDPLPCVQDEPTNLCVPGPVIEVVNDEAEERDALLPHVVDT